MIYDSELTKQKILESAKQEFLTYGFNDAQLREIAKNAGVTTGAIYRHFKNKNELFSVLIQPVYNLIVNHINCNTTEIELQDVDKYFRTKFDSCAKFTTPDHVKLGIDLMLHFCELLYQHYDLFKLLLCKNEGTQFTNPVDQFIDFKLNHDLNYLKLMYDKGLLVRMPSTYELKVLTRNFVISIFDLVIKDIPYEEMENYVRAVTSFYHFGWDCFLKSSYKDFSAVEYGFQKEQ